MIDFHISQIFPAFMLSDRNGFAMAKAIEAGLRYYLDVVKRGIDTLQNIDAMPEWRLDERAYELNCLYDYNADIEAKRHWIRDANYLYAAHGTPQAIYNYLEGYFDQVNVEESWQYGGEPFHFRICVSGSLTKEKADWVRKAVAEAKNVRSVMDELSIGSTSGIQVTGSGQIVARVYPPLCGEYAAGQWPEIL